MHNAEDKRMLLTIAENFEELAKQVNASSSTEAKGSVLHRGKHDALGWRFLTSLSVDVATLSFAVALEEQ
jgi:hypothetical protein